MLGLHPVASGWPGGASELGFLHAKSRLQPFEHFLGFWSMKTIIAYYLSYFGEGCRHLGALRDLIMMWLNMHKNVFKPFELSQQPLSIFWTVRKGELNKVCYIEANYLIVISIKEYTLPKKIFHLLFMSHNSQWSLSRGHRHQCFKRNLSPILTAPKSLPIELNEGSGIEQGFVKELALNTTETDLIPSSTYEFSQACSGMIPEQSLDVTHNTLPLLPHNKGRTKFGRKRGPRDVVEEHWYSGDGYGLAI